MPRCCADEQPIDVEVADDTYEACMKMRVSELKADAEWWAGYQEAVQLNLGSWGWNAAAPLGG